MITRRIVLSALALPNFSGPPLGQNVVGPEDFGAARSFSPNIDDTPFVQAAADVVNKSGGTLLLTRPYNLGSYRTIGHGAQVSLYLWGDNITVRCAPGGALISTVKNLPQNYRPVFCFGGGRLEQQEIQQASTIASPVFPLIGPIAKGTKTIRLANPRDVDHFKAGDIAYVRTGQVLAHRTTEPDSELAQVIATSPQTGTLVFARGVAKPYTQEFTGPDGISSPTITGPPAPLGVANVTDRVMRNLRFENLLVDGRGSLQAVSLWSIFGFVQSGGIVRHSTNGTGARDVAGASITHATWVHDGIDSHLAYFLGPSTGCSHWRYNGVTGQSAGFAFMHFHEGVADVRTYRLTVRCAGSPNAVNGAIDIRDRAYDIDLGDDYFIDIGTAETQAVFVDQNCGGGGRVGAGSIRSASRSAAAVRIDAPNWTATPRMLGTNHVTKLAEP